MTTPSQPVVNVINQFNEDLNIYTFTVPSGATTNDPSTMYPIYTLVGSAPANQTTVYTPPASEPLQYLNFARVSDGQPLASTVTNILNDSTITITSGDLTKSQTAFAFYQAYVGSPYSPTSLQINEIILNVTDLTQQKQQLNTWFQSNNAGFDYSNFSAVTHWAENDVRAWSGPSGKPLYCYSPDTPKP